jgi:hypothetical protein
MVTLRSWGCVVIVQVGVAMVWGCSSHSPSVTEEGVTHWISKYGYCPESLVEVRKIGARYVPLRFEPPPEVATNPVRLRSWYEQENERMKREADEGVLFDVNRCGERKRLVCRLGRRSGRCCDCLYLRVALSAAADAVDGGALMSPEAGPSGPPSNGTPLFEVE